MPSIAVIGCGRWGQNLARNFTDLNCLTVVCCTNPQNARETAHEFAVDHKTSADILLDKSIDGVVIATSSENHFELASQALAHKKHVYVEKPVAFSFKEAKALAALAKENNRILTAGHLLQYHPAFLKTKALVQEGLIGNIRKIHTRRLFMGRIRQTENVMWDLLPHDLSMILSLIKTDVTSVRAFANATFGKSHDTVWSTLRFSCGTTAYLGASWCFPLKEQTLTLIGENGTLVFDDTAPWDQKIKHIPFSITAENDDILLSPAQATAIPVDVAEPLKLECAHFIDCIKHGRSSRTGPDEFLPVMQLCQNIHDIIGD